MKIQLNSLPGILAVVLAAGLLARAVRAQQNTTGHASDFTSVEYFEPPHQQQMKSRLAGTEARPLAGGLLVIKDLKLEIFDTNGVKEVVIKAPHCVYDTQSGTANSPGHLWLETGDGASHVEGDGFLWRQTNSLLTISNNVRTVLEKTSEIKAGL
jgi:hypothetical protein